MGRGRQDWDNRDYTGRGQWGGEDGEGANGKGRREGGKGEGEKKGQRGGGILQMDMIQAHGMPGWNEVTEVSD